MKQVLEEALHEYNETNATMDLVLFEDAMKHIARIVRVIMNSSGHALLVGEYNNYMSFLYDHSPHQRV